MPNGLDSTSAPILSQLQLAISCDPTTERSVDDDHLSKVPFLLHVMVELGKIPVLPKVQRQFGIPESRVLQKEHFT